MKKRLLLLLITAAMLISFMSVFCFGASGIIISIDPSVFLCGNIYNVVWKTNVAGIGYVEYTYNGTLYRVYDEESGVVRTDDTIHTVSVPVDHLDAAGGYTVTSTAVQSRTAYKVSYGGSCTASRSFTGYCGQDEMVIWNVSDTHASNTRYIKNAVARLNQNPNIITLLGDITNTISNESDLNYIFSLAELLSGGEIPVVYSRGNHETRGRFASSLLQYLPSDDGDFYFTFTYGPLSAIVLDFGEDKIDTQVEYNGLVDYENYRNNITNWLSNLNGYPGEPEYRIAMCHGPNIKNHFGHNWLEILSQYGTDLMVSGHYHSLGMWYPANYDVTDSQWNPAGSSAVNCLDFPVLLDGSHVDNSSFKASQLVLKDGKIEIKGVSDTEDDLLNYTVTAGKNIKADSTFDAPDKKPSTDTQFEIAGSYMPSTDFGFTSKPTVFDTGDTYTVAFATTEGMTATANVFVEKDGTVYRFSDNNAGALSYNTNTVGFPSVTSGDKNLHAVSIPKKYLENSKYNVVAQHLHNTGYYTSLVQGSKISTGYIEFNGYTEGKDVNMLVISDWNTETDMLSKTRALAKQADVIVSGGNIVSQLQTAQDMAEYLRITGILSGGKRPVFFVRGENEIAGEYAPYLTRIIKNSTKKMYELVSYGPVSAVILDTSALYSDSYSGYNGLVSFAQLRKEQLSWLKKVSYGDATYKLALSSAPNLFDVVDTDYSKTLNSLGTDLAVFSYSESPAFNQVGTRAQNYATASVGRYSSGTAATMLTFSNGNITVKAINENGNAIMTNTFSVTDNDVAAFSDVDEGAWYTNAVSYAATQQLLVGTSATEFSPQDTVTRAQAAVVLAKLGNADLTVSGSTPFTDVRDGEFYTNAVAWCYENGVTAGTSATTFSPDDTLTREQFCTLVCNMFPDRFINTEKYPFTDYDSVSDYAKAPVSALANAGIVKGVGGGRFSPKSGMTRAMVAQVLYNAEL